MKTEARIRELKKMEEDVLEDRIKNLNGVKVLGYTLQVVKSKGRSYLQARKGRRDNIYVGRVHKIFEVEEIISDKIKLKQTSF